MLEDTTVACLSSHKWTEDKSIQGGNSFSLCRPPRPTPQSTHRSLSFHHFPLSLFLPSASFLPSSIFFFPPRLVSCYGLISHSSFPSHFCLSFISRHILWFKQYRGPTSLSKMGGLAPEMSHKSRHRVTSGNEMGSPSLEWAPLFLLCSRRRFMCQVRGWLVASDTRVWRLILTVCIFFTCMYSGIFHAFPRCQSNCHSFLTC